MPHGGSNVRITGVKQTIAALRAFEPEIEDALGKQIKEALRATEREAKAIYPRGAWTVGRTRKKLLGYVAARAGGTRARSWGDSAPGIRAGIFEFIGTQYSGDRPAVLKTIESLNARYGSPGRFLWEAWERTGQGILDEIKESVQAAEKELQSRLDAAGVSY